MKKSLRFDSRRWKRRLDTTAVLWFVVVVASNIAVADETIRRVQEELRKRHLYFGDIDGRATPETQTALKRYQERKGFSPTGVADTDTARALGIPVQDSPASSDEIPWPEEPVLRSEVARSDRAFLEHADPDEAVREPIAERSTGEELDASAKAVPEAGSPVPVPTQESVNPVVKGIVERAREALEGYLTAAQHEDPDAEMAFYADKVNYFDHGVVDRTFIRKDIDRYRQRWPKRDYRLLDVQTRPVPGRTNEIEVRFRLQFAVSNVRNSVRGTTDNAFRMEMAPEGPRLVALHERRIRD